MAQPPQPPAVGSVLSRDPKRSQRSWPAELPPSAIPAISAEAGKSRNIPVILPPGRALLTINPLPTGSLSRSPATMGTVMVAARAARTAIGPVAWIKSTLRPMRSAANAASNRGRRQLPAQGAQLAPLVLRQTVIRNGTPRHATPQRRLRARIEVANLKDFLRLLRPKRRGPYAVAPLSSVMNSRLFI